LVQGEYVEFRIKHDLNNSKHPISAFHVTGIKNGHLLFFYKMKDTRYKKPFPI